jgi:hypothetical protein
MKWSIVTLNIKNTVFPRSFRKSKVQNRAKKGKPGESCNDHNVLLMMLYLKTALEMRIGTLEVKSRRAIGRRDAASCILNRLSKIIISNVHEKPVKAVHHYYTLFFASYLCCISHSLMGCHYLQLVVIGTLSSGSIATSNSEQTTLFPHLQIISLNDVLSPVMVCK